MFENSSTKKKLQRQDESLQADSKIGQHGLAIAPPSYSLDVVDKLMLPKHPITIQRQSNLSINQPNDDYEREADTVAEQVMRMPHASVQRCACGGIVGSDGECKSCKAKRLGLQRNSGVSLGTSIAPKSVHQTLRQSGQALDSQTQGFMESRFGYDFSDVRVHTNSQAAKSAADVRANAYTVGKNIVFYEGQYTPASDSGKWLLAHELSHVIQQTSEKQNLEVHRQSDIRLMRSGFDSTFKICYRVKKSREFKVTQGGVKVVLNPQEVDKNIPNCTDFKYFVSLTQVKNWWPDKEVATCEATTGGADSLSFGNVENGTYYLTIWRNFDNPYCCLEGDISVFDEAVAANSSTCEVQEYPSFMEVVHSALGAAGFIPALGAVPDAIDAVIYAAEGDWTNAGVSAIAIVPVFGDGAKIVYKGGKAVVKASGKSIVKKGTKELTANLKQVKAAAPGLGESMIKAEKKSGLAVDLAAQPHKNKTAFREGTGAAVESAHMVPTVAVKKVQGYSRSEALTALLPRESHRAFDKHWMDWARQRVAELRKQGLPEQVSVAEWEAALNRAADSVPALRGKTAGNMSVMIRTEFYQTLGLKSNQMLPLPKFN